MKLFLPWLRKNGFWGHSRSPKPESGSFGVKIRKFFHIGYKYMKLKHLTSALPKNNFRGHLRSPEPKSGSFGVKTRKFSNIGLWYMKMKVSELWFRKNGSRCHLRSPKPKSGSFGVKTPKFLEIRKFPNPKNHLYLRFFGLYLISNRNSEDLLQEPKISPFFLKKKISHNFFSQK